MRGNLEEEEGYAQGGRRVCRRLMSVLEEFSRSGGVHWSVIFVFANAWSRILLQQMWCQFKQTYRREMSHQRMLNKKCMGNGKDDGCPAPASH